MNLPEKLPNYCYKLGGRDVWAVHWAFTTPPIAPKPAPKYPLTEDYLNFNYLILELSI